MRLSELSSKEMIDYEKGERLGILGQTDLIIQKDTGKIEAFLLPSVRLFGFKKNDRDIVVHWQQIKTIGEDMIIVDVSKYD